MPFAVAPREYDPIPDFGRAVLGTMTFGSQVNRTDAEAMVGRARDAGIVAFDTANTYNDGRSEEILGQIVSSFRDQVLISTKVGAQRGRSPDDRALSADSIHREIDESLRRLNTDWVDVYYLHKPDPQTPLEETLMALQQLVDRGKIRHVAQSNYAAWQIATMLRLAVTEHLPPMLISQPTYNLLSRRIEDEYSAFSAYYGLTNIVYSPLAGGMLTGKYRWTDFPSPGTRFSEQVYRNRYWNEAMFSAVSELESIAGDAGLSLIELSLGWLLSRESVAAVLLGASRLEHFDANLEAIGAVCPDAETCARVDDVWALLHGPAPSYNR